MDFKVLRGRFDVAVGGVVARQMVHCHMCDLHWVREQDGQCPLCPHKTPTGTCQNGGPLGGEKGDLSVEKGTSECVVNDSNGTWIAVRGLLKRDQRGIPNRVRHPEGEVYVCEHLLLITLAPSQTYTHTHRK